MKNHGAFLKPGAIISPGLTFWFCWCNGCWLLVLLPTKQYAGISTLGHLKRASRQCAFVTTRVRDNAFRLHLLLQTNILKTGDGEEQGVGPESSEIKGCRVAGLQHINQVCGDVGVRRYQFVRI